MSTVPRTTVYEFGGFRLDSGRHVLTGPDGSPCAVAPRALEMLRYFLEQRGTLIPKAALLRAIWPDVIVTENNLSQHISSLRRVLQDGRDARQFIVTVPGLGFRFTTDVVEKEPEDQTWTANDAEARRLCLQAQALIVHIRTPNLIRAIELLQRAIARDPHFVRAHALLANAYCTLFQIQHLSPAVAMLDTLAAAQSAAKEALALEPGHSAAHCALGFIAMRRGRWCDAELHFRSSLSAGTDHIDARYHAAQLLMATGRLRAALAHIEQLYELAPADPMIVLGLSLISSLLGRDDESSLWLDLALDLGVPATLPPVPVIRSLLERHAGSYPAACEQARILLPPPLADPAAEAHLRRIFSGLENPDRRDDGIAALRELVARAGAVLEAGGPVLLMLVNWATLLGALDEAYELANRFAAMLESRKAFRGFPGSLWKPEMRSFRADPRFHTFVSRLGLPQYWQRFGSPDGYEWTPGGLRCETGQQAR